MSTGVALQFQCNRCGLTVISSPPSTSTLICPYCTSTVRGLLQNPNPNLNPTVNSANSGQLGHSNVISGFGGSPTIVDPFWLPPVLSLRHYFRMIPPGIQFVVNRNGPRPAARAAVEALPSVNISEEMVRNGVSQCVICNSCPLCRFELPTEDVEYVNMRRGPSSGEFSNRRVGNLGRNRYVRGSDNEDID